jgi:hypothetical protein
MAKYVAYIPGMDSFLMDGNTPFIDEEKEVRRVIADETVHPKHYEARPVTFLKTWAKKQQAKEAEVKPFRFSPPSPEFHYTPAEGQHRYALVVGDENISKSGLAVKHFETREEGVIFATRSIAGLTKEFPALGYYLLDTENHVYTDGITIGSHWRAEDYVPGKGNGSTGGLHIGTPETPARKRGRKPRATN